MMGAVRYCFSLLAKSIFSLSLTHTYTHTREREREREDEKEDRHAKRHENGRKK